MKILIILLISLFLISGCQEDDKFFIPQTSPNITNQLNNLTSDMNESPINENLTNNETNQTEEPKNSCLDTDGGKIYSKQGTTVVSNGKLRQVKDYCDNSGTLVEYYCKDNNELGIDIYECFSIGDVCENGVCGELNTSTNDTNSS